MRKIITELHEYDTKLFSYYLDSPNVNFDINKSNAIVAGWFTSYIELDQICVEIDGEYFEFDFNKARPDVKINKKIIDEAVIVSGFRYNIKPFTEKFMFGIKINDSIIWLKSYHYEFISDITNYINEIVNLDSSNLVIDCENKLYKSLASITIGCNWRTFDELSEFIEKNISQNQFYNKLIIYGCLKNYRNEEDIRKIIALSINLCSELIFVDDVSDFRTYLLPVIYRVARCLDLPSPIKMREHDSYFGISFHYRHLKDNLISIHNDSIKKIILGRVVEFSKFIEDLQFAINNQIGYSFVRINHCENRIYGYLYSFGENDINATYKIQFGRILNETSSKFIANKLREAVNNATILGLPTKFPGFAANLTRILEYSSYIHLRDFALLDKKMYIDVNIHLRFFNKREFADFLIKNKEVNVIGCRDISKVLFDNIGVHVIKWYRLPQEHKYQYEGENITEHFPDVFEDIINNLVKEVKPGDLFLVGGGILGKIYCETIRQCGGVAIDVGSFMDYLVGLQTRGPKDYWPKIEWIKE